MENDVYRRLAKKIDGLTLRTPWNETFYSILKELYMGEEADVHRRLFQAVAGQAALMSDMFGSTLSHNCRIHCTF